MKVRNLHFRTVLFIGFLFLMSGLLVLNMTIQAELPSDGTRTMAVDFNQDGASESIQFNSYSVYIPDSVTGTIREVTFAKKMKDIKPLDVDSDGFMDLQVYFTSNQTHILHAKDLLSSVPEAEILNLNVCFYQVYNTGYALDNVWDSSVGNFDGDGNKDILITTQIPHRAMVVYENIGNNNYSQVFITPYEANIGAYTRLATGDTDGDEHQELIGGMAGTLCRIFLYENVGDNNYVKREINISEPHPSGAYSIKQVMVGDTDMDGEMEIIFLVSSSSLEGADLYIYEHSGNVGENVYEKIYEYNTVSYLVDFTIGDSDNDGFQEIVLGIGGFGITEPYIRRIEYCPGGPDQHLGYYYHKIVPSNTGENGLLLSPTVADLDNDNENELVFGGTSTNGGSIYIFESPADDQYSLAYKDDGIDGNVISTTTGPVKGSNYPAIVSGSFGGQLDMWTFRDLVDPPYENIMSPSLFFTSDIRGLDLDFMDPDSSVDIVIAVHYVDKVYVYEQSTLCVPEEEKEKALY